MANDPLTLLLRLRRTSFDEARRALAECLQAESAPREEIRRIEQAIWHETRLATEPGGDDGAVEAFAIWLRRVNAERARVAETLIAAETQTTEARAVLIAAGQAVETVETLMKQRDADSRFARARVERRELDEMAARAGPIHTI